MNPQKLLLILLALIALTPTAWAQRLSGSGTTEDPYLITSSADWVTFAQSVTNDSTYAGQTVKLTADIAVTEMVGLYRTFSGTLDGDGHTITLALSGGGEGTALFYWIENATLKNLKAQGTVTTTDRRPATFAVIVNGNSTISNCWSTVAVSSTRTSGWVDGGGFVGRVSSNATLNMTDCAFHGSVTFTEGATTGGGMVGYTQSNATVNLTNCLYSPTSLTLNVSEYNPRVFVSGSVEGNLTNCYYNNVAATSVLENQGTDASGMSNEELAAALGPNWKITDGLVVPFLSMYYIGSASEWHAFTTTLNNGTSFNGQTVVLTTDIPTAEEIANGTTAVTTMAGTESHPFRGTLDGGGHTITLALSGSGPGTALFYLIEGATLKNLKVQGTVTTSEYRPATFAAFVEGDCTISNCWCTVAVSSTKTNSWVDGGGFVGRVSGTATLNMTDCAFHGSVTFTEGATTGGGMVGYTQSNATVNLTNCLYSPTALTLNVSQYYPRVFVSGYVEGNLTNCYYNEVAKMSVLENQGIDASGMTNEALATALGEDWYVYNGMVVPFSGRYYISSAAEWDAFVTAVNNGKSFSGQTVALTTDIPTAEEIFHGQHGVRTMAGTESHPFCGTFDGQGHTLALRLISTATYSAPFRYTDGATFQNLKTDGTNKTTNKLAAGMVGQVCDNGCTFTNCICDVEITSAFNGNATNGGFVGYIYQGNCIFEGCAFTGKLLREKAYPTCNGGFVGLTESYTNATATFTNCVFHPEQVTMGTEESQTFAHWRLGNSSVIIGNNCYYSQTFGEAQGKLMHSITAGEYVTVAFDGEATPYDVSGITAYSVGMVFDSTLYAGQGETVSLNLACTPPPGYTYGSFSASAGTLNGTENPYMLTMPNEDVTIIPASEYTVSVACTPNIAGAAQVSLDNTNWSSSVSPAVGQEVYFKTNDVIGYRRAGYTIETENGEWVDFANGHFTMPAANVTYYVDFSPNPAYIDNYTVTLSPGLVGGEPIVYTFDPETTAPNAATADTCQFYYVNYNTLGFRLPTDYLPNSFIEPYEGAFLGWDGWSNDGYITLTSTTTTFTAQWFYYIVTLSPGVGGGEPIVYAFNPETVAPNAATAQNWQFYYVSNDEAGFRLGDDCPNSFTAPDGLGFSGWSNSGYVTLTSGATTFTAQWGTPGTPVNYIDENGEMHTCSNYTILPGGSHYYSDVTLEAGWYVVDSDITYFNYFSAEMTLNLNGDVTLILCNGKTVTHPSRYFVKIHGHDHSLTIYGQSLDPNVAGTLNISGTTEAITDLTTYTQHSGNVVIPGGSEGIIADFLTINGGTVRTDTEFDGLIGDNVVINGGKVETNRILAGYNITLGYTRPDDYILAGQYYYNYFNNGGTMAVKSGQSFYYENEGQNVIVSGTIANPNSAIAWKTLRPYGLATYTLTPTAYTLTNDGYTDITCTLSSLELLEVWNGSSMVPATGLSFYMNGGTLTDSIGNSIPFLVDNGSHSGAAARKAQGGVFSSEGDTLIMAVYIDPEVYDTLAPGIYTGIFDYDSYWNENPNIHGLSGSIALTLVIPEPSTVTQTVALAQGWNWISTYLDTDEVDCLAMIEEALGDYGVSIATSDDIAEYLGDGFWLGLEGYQWTNGEMIMVEVNADCTVSLQGPAVDPSTVSITINPGWNWIGFPLNSEITLEDALTNFEPELGDGIASYEGITEYIGIWTGDFETLVPGHGYMYYSASEEPKTLVFSTGTK